MAERLIVMSTHEPGQAASHEISATESHEISQSTDTVYDFISVGIDEGRAAMKRICFDSLVACGSDDVELTVSSRYPASVVKQAGFTVVSDQMGDLAGYSRVTGSKNNLVHDLIFTSRDGGDRPAGQQAATVLIQMLQAIGGLEKDIQQAVIGAMGKEKVFEILNQIFKCADAGVDLKLELKPGDDNNLLISQNQQVMDGMQRLAQAVQKDSQDIDQIHHAMTAILDIMGKVNPQAAQMVAASMKSEQQNQSQSQQQPQPPTQQPVSPPQPQ